MREWKHSVAIVSLFAADSKSYNLNKVYLSNKYSFKQHWQGLSVQLLGGFDFSFCERMLKFHCLSKLVSFRVWVKGIEIEIKAAKEVGKA